MTSQGVKNKKVQHETKSSDCTVLYLIVESVSFVLHRDLTPINPKKTIEIINSRALSFLYIALVRGQYIDNGLEFIMFSKPPQLLNKSVIGQL